MEGPEGAMTGGPPGFLHDLRRPYKEGQGVLTRRIALWTGIFFAAWGARDLWIWLQRFSALQKAILPDPLFGGRVDLSHLPMGGPALGGSVLIATAIGIAVLVWLAWFLKRPWLVDRLIDTESEMKKVSWPASDEAWGATKVVTVVVLLFTGMLFVIDVAITTGMQLLTGLPL